MSKSILTKAARQFVQTQEVAPRLQEAIYINQALLALKNCVRALVANDPHVKPETRHPKPEPRT